MTDNTGTDRNEYWDILTTEEAFDTDPIQLELFDLENDGLLEF